jgi:hypothetical protein
MSIPDRVRIGPVRAGALLAGSKGRAALDWCKRDLDHGAFISNNRLKGQEG